MIAKRLYVAVACIGSVCGVTLLAEEKTHVYVTPQSTTPATYRLLCGVVNRTRLSEQQETFFAHLQRCLAFSRQFDVELKRVKKLPSARAFRSVYGKGYDGAVFVSCVVENKRLRVSWWLEREFQAAHTFAEGDERGAAYHLARDIMHALTGQAQPFCSRLLYRRREGAHDTLVRADFDGSYPETVYRSSRIITSPAWVPHADAERFVFSQFTPTNVRLLTAAADGGTRILLDCDGTNAGVSFAPHTQDMFAYCRSGNIWVYRYDRERRKGIHSLVVRERGVAACPNFLTNGDIVYCCGGKIKKWLAAEKKAIAFPIQGYAVAPSYHEASGRVVYSQRRGGYMQVCVYDTRTGEAWDVTRPSQEPSSCDYRADKIDPAWSPCGQYCAFTWEYKGESRIGVVHVDGGPYHFVSPEGHTCAFPAWSW